MQAYVSEFREIVLSPTPDLLAISDSDSGSRPADGEWSHREILGHLIDSASNNHQRFVRAQFQDDLVFPGYDQDGWVRVQRYQEASWEELVILWRALNLHLARVMEAVPDSIRLRPNRRHNLHQRVWRTIPADEPATLDDFMRDYVRHLDHHLRQILDPSRGAQP